MADLAGLIGERKIGPPVCAIFEGWDWPAIEGVWERSLGWYTRTLTWTMGHRPLAMGFSALILIGTVVMFRLAAHWVMSWRLMAAAIRSGPTPSVA